MVTQISAASSSPNSNSAKSHVKKIKHKNGKFEWEVVRCRYSRDNFAFRAAISISYREIAAKRVTFISVLSLIKLFYLSQ